MMDVKAIDDLRAVLDPRNGRTDNGCVLVNESVIKQSLDALEAAQARIKELEAKQRWVPVSERLPEPFVHVALVNVDRYENAPDEMKEPTIKAIGYLNPHPSNHWSIRGERAATINGYPHWMPLPQPPEQESE